MNTWKLIYTNYNPVKQLTREALCCLGNGCFATRGAAEEASANFHHYPGTYLAGGYNRLKSEVSGKIIENEDLVNWPNWLPLTFRHEEGDWFSLDNVELLEFKQELNLKDGILERTVEFRQDNKSSRLFSRRFVSMHDAHLAGIFWELTPLDWEGKIYIKSGIDGQVTNWGVERYRDLNNRHLLVTGSGQSEEGNIYLECETLHSKIRMAQCARARVSISSSILKVHDLGNNIFHELEVACKRGKAIAVEKMVSVYTSRDFAISEPLKEAMNKLEKTDSFEIELQKHIRAWRHLWKRCNIEIEPEEESQLILRLHIFHLLQTVSFNTIDKDTGVPARGWHGEAYRGHIFWDELFIFPFLNLRLPELTRELLMYRFRRLPQARWAAEESGYAGAMYPWQSGSNGREESQVIHLNPYSGHWLADNTFLQRHINAAIVYNIWQYYQANNDLEFFDFYGAEMILEIAKFWSAITKFDESKQRYVIHNVVGPDEYHTSYPGSTEPGINNNAYTNFMAAWVLKHALELENLLDEERLLELHQNLNISSEELAKWDKISREIFIPFHGDMIVSQFEGYDELKEFNWKKYRTEHGEHMRLDRILEKEGDDVNKYKASKQADVLMLFYLFSAEELKEMFEWLNYEFDLNFIQRNIDYYHERTSHGSTLSQLVQSWVMARSDRRQSWDRFNKALVSDFKDVQGGTTAEGIHLGAMAGTVDIMQRCYTGLNIHDNRLHLAPVLPENLGKLNLKFRFRGNWIRISIHQNKMELCLEKGWAKELPITVYHEEIILKSGKSMFFDTK